MEQKSFSDMKGNIGANVGDTSSAFATRIGEWINRRWRRVYNSLLLAEVWENVRSDTFSTTDGTAEYALPYDFEDMISLMDETNNRSLDRITQSELVQRFGYNLSEKGGPIAYLQMGSGVVDTQPTSASAIRVQSSSASDVSQSVRIRGLVSGVELSEQVLLTGTTPVSSTNSFTTVYQISLNATCVGKITADANSAAVTIGVIPIGMTQAFYKRLKLHYVPSGTFTLRRTFRRRFLPLSNADDYIPDGEIQDIVELFAEADAWRAKRQFAKAADLINDAGGQLQDAVFRRTASADKMHQMAVLPDPRDTV